MSWVRKRNCGNNYFLDVHPYNLSNQPPSHAFGIIFGTVCASRSFTTAPPTDRCCVQLGFQEQVQRNEPVAQAAVSYTESSGKLIFGIDA